MGDKLGLYRAMAGRRPAHAGGARRRAPDTAERYVREWLNAQAAGGYVDYDPETGRYTLPPEQAVALTDESQPRLPARASSRSRWGRCIDSPRITEAARNGDRVRLARARARRPRGLRAVLPARLQRQPDRLRGCRRSTASSRSSSAARASPTSAAGTARRRS